MIVLCFRQKTGVLWHWVLVVETNKLGEYIFLRNALNRELFPGYFRLEIQFRHITKGTSELSCFHIRILCLPLSSFPIHGFETENRVCVLEGKNPFSVLLPALCFTFGVEGAKATKLSLGRGWGWWKTMKQGKAVCDNFWLFHVSGKLWINFHSSCGVFHCLSASVIDF